jgi:hypothetical protein
MISLQKNIESESIMREIVSARKSASSTYILHGFKWNFILEDTITVYYDLDLYSVSKWFWLG